MQRGEGFALKDTRLSWMQVGMRPAEAPGCLHGQVFRPPGADACALASGRLFRGRFSSLAAGQEAFKKKKYRCLEPTLVKLSRSPQDAVMWPCLIPGHHHKTRLHFFVTPCSGQPRPLQGSSEAAVPLSHSFDMLGLFHFISAS